MFTVDWNDASCSMHGTTSIVLHRIALLFYHFSPPLLRCSPGKPRGFSERDPGRLEGQSRRAGDSMDVSWLGGSVSVECFSHYLC